VIFPLQPPNAELVIFMHSESFWWTMFKIELTRKPMVINPPGFLEKNCSGISQ